MSMTLIQAVEAEQLKAEIPAFGPGDTVRVHVKVVEGARERIQVFEGMVIRRRAGGANENFTVRRSASHGIGVERTFLINSPRIDHIDVVRTGRVRRAKLYYLRGRTGRAARIRERRRPVGSTALRGARAVVEVEAPVSTAVTGFEANEVEEEAEDAGSPVEDAIVVAAGTNDAVVESEDGVDSAVGEATEADTPSDDSESEEKTS